MELASGKIKFDVMLLNRLARKSSVELFVRIMRGVLSVLMLLLVILTIKQVITSVLAASTERTKLASDLENAVKPVGATNKATTPARDYKIISKQSVFGQTSAKPVAATPAPKAATATAFLLIGTFISDNEPSYAIIEDKKKNLQDVFVLNEMVFGEAKLVSIKTDRVEINRNGQIEVLKLDDTPESSGPSTPGVAVSGTDEFTVQETELNQALDNLPLLLTQARAVPYFKDGRSIGLRLFAIKTGSLFEKIGLKNGDILKTINGNSLGDLTQAVKLFETLKNERSLSLVLERDKADREFKYQIR